MAETAYPLTWPLGWPRSKSRDRARFSAGKDASYTDSAGKYIRRTVAREASMNDAKKRLQLELDRLGAIHTILSTNVELRLDGTPYSNRKDPADTGAAVYFTLQGKKVVLACDRWDRVPDNIIAIAKHIDALRGQERWGVGSLEQAFRGYQALPSPDYVKPWREVLGMDITAIDQAEFIYRTKAKVHHPDRGGNPIQMAELNAAIKSARQEFGAAANGT
jgi:hypothetical protein